MLSIGHTSLGRAEDTNAFCQHIFLLLPFEILVCLREMKGAMERRQINKHLCKRDVVYIRKCINRR